MNICDRNFFRFIVNYFKCHEKNFSHKKLFFIKKKKTNKISESISIFIKVFRTNLMSKIFIENYFKLYDIY